MFEIQFVFKEQSFMNNKKILRINKILMVMLQKTFYLKEK